MLGGIVDIAAENIEDKGIARKGLIPPNQQYGYGYKAKSDRSLILSKTRPVEKTGKLRAMFKSFSEFARAEGNYAATKDSMVARVFEFAGGYKMTWRSFSAKLGSIENRKITPYARQVLPGLPFKDWPKLGGNHAPRRFISRRFSPALTAAKKALDEWGKTFPVRAKSPNAPPRKIKPPKLTLGD